MVDCNRPYMYKIVVSCRELVYGCNVHSMDNQLYLWMV